MSEQTLTRAYLSEAVYQEVGLSRNESAELLEAVLNEITNALAEGDTVKLSSFGSFSIRQKGQRVGRNPKTGEEVPILPRRVLVFRPSQVLKNRINQGLETLRPFAVPTEIDLHQADINDAITVGKTFSNLCEGLAGGFGIEGLAGMVECPWPGCRQAVGNTGGFNQGNGIEHIRIERVLGRDASPETVGQINDRLSLERRLLGRGYVKGMIDMLELRSPCG
jgi:integration host factor subunit alpha